jgi:N-acyl-D-amino-acid deacylase
MDAKGLVLAPGVIDLHTHYDAQLTWDKTSSPSLALGVTTVVIGNCGFGIARTPINRRDTVLANLSEVEGMSLDALRAGVGLCDVRRSFIRGRPIRPTGARARAAMLPGVGIGYATAPLVGRFLDRRRLRIAILTISGASAVALLVR